MTRLQCLYLRGLGVGACIIAAALWSGHAFAAVTNAGPTVTPLRNGAVLSYPLTATQQAQGRQILAGLLEGTVKISDTAVLRGAAGEVVSVVASRVISGPTVRAAAVAAAAVGVVAAGSAIANALQTANARRNSSGTGFEMSVDHTSSASIVYTMSAVDTVKYSSAGTACTAGMAKVNASDLAYYTPRGFTFVAGAVTLSGMTCTRNWTLNGSPSSASAPVQQFNETWCVNSSGVAVVQPTGGLCPQGTYTPATAEQVQAALLASPAPIDGPAVVTELLQRGATIPGDHPVTVTGPAAAPPRTVTTTGPGGAVNTTTINNTYNYAGDTITWNETVVNNGPDGETTTESDTPADERTDCEKSPGKVGCMDAGEPPTDKPVWETKEIVFAPESLGISGACPASQALNLPWSGLTLTVNWQPACDIAPGVRAALLAMTAMGALLYILMAVRS